MGERKAEEIVKHDSDEPDADLISWFLVIDSRFVWSCHVPSGDGIAVYSPM